MNKELILKKAIEKAIENGWELPLSDYNDREWEINEFGLQRSYNDYIDYQSVIFNHNFAKAFWGEEEVEELFPVNVVNENVFGGELSHNTECGFPIIHTIPSWKLHLQQMVISPDPILYLAKYL